MSNKFGKNTVSSSPQEYDYKTSKTESPKLAGNWQRLKYDYGNYGKSLQQSTSPLDWILDPNYVHRCNPCRPTEVGYISKFGVSYDSRNPLIDTESELFNITRKASNDPGQKYIPYCPNCGNKKITCGENECLEGYPCGGGVVSGCEQCQPQLFHFPSCGITRQYTRTSNPTGTLRETGQNRFQPTYLDHQHPTRWEIQGEVGINYRMVAKDNHVPCVPIPLDQTLALPRAKPLPVKLTVPTKANPIEPMHNYYQGSSTTCVPKKC